MNTFRILRIVSILVNKSNEMTKTNNVLFHMLKDFGLPSPVGQPFID